MNIIKFHNELLLFLSFIPVSLLEKENVSWNSYDIDTYHNQIVIL